jgi:hypothetical protein
MVLGIFTGSLLTPSLPAPSSRLAQILEGLVSQLSMASDRMVSSLKRRVEILLNVSDSACCANEVPREAIRGRGLARKFARGAGVKPENVDHGNRKLTLFLRRLQRDRKAGDGVASEHAKRAYLAR